MTNSLKYISKLVTEVFEWLSDLDFFVKSNYLILMINYSLNKVHTVALVKETFDSVPATKKLQLFCKCFEFDVCIEVLAFLKNSDCHCLFYMIFIFDKFWVILESCNKRCVSIFRDFEGWIFKFKELKQDFNVGTAGDNMSVLAIDLTNKRRSWRNALNLKHLSHFENFLSDCLR